MVWRAGPSYLSREQWEAGETLQPNRGPAPLAFVNDPAGGFSGQHGGHFTVDGNLLVYDNASHCGAPDGFPQDAKGLTQCGEATRAVSYAIDTANHEAVFQREFRIPGKGRMGPGGHAEPLDSGDWLISWSEAGPAPNTAMQVDAETNAEKLSLTRRNIWGRERGDVQTTRVVMVSPVALAERVEPLAATIVSQPQQHSGPRTGRRRVVAFNRPVVDIESAAPSVTVTGASLSVAPHKLDGARPTPMRSP